VGAASAHPTRRRRRDRFDDVAVGIAVAAAVRNPAVSTEEARAVVYAGDFTHPRVPLDDDESALVTRLRSLLV